MKDLDIVYCKDCCNFFRKTVNDCSAIYFCRKYNVKFSIESPDLFCNKRCFNKRKIKKGEHNG